MAQQLLIVKIDGKHYFKDDRLQEYRETTNPHNKIAFEDADERTIKEVEHKRTLTQKIKRRLR